MLVQEAHLSKVKSSNKIASLGTQQIEHYKCKNGWVGQLGTLPV